MALVDFKLFNFEIKSDKLFIDLGKKKVTLPLFKILIGLAFLTMFAAVYFNLDKIVLFIGIAFAVCAAIVRPDIK